MVPTADEDSPETSSERPKNHSGCLPQQRLQGSMRLFKGADMGQACIVEGCRGHDQHGGIDETGDPHGDHARR